VSESDEFQKPKPKLRAHSVHDLRAIVSARHKMLASSKPTEEGKKLLQETYKADDDSCLNFIAWLKGEEPGKPQTKNGPNAMERIHVSTDAETGDERYVETEPGSIPPRPAGSPPRPGQKPRGK
jgi:hypothetical protein